MAPEAFSPGSQVLFHCGLESLTSSTTVILVAFLGW